jgi:hypothetical protein
MSAHTPDAEHIHPLTGKPSTRRRPVSARTPFCPACHQGITFKDLCPLHAAAPELLEALEELLNYGEPEVDHPALSYVAVQLDKDTLDRARAAIAKVRGETA